MKGPSLTRRRVEIEQTDKDGRRVQQLRIRLQVLELLIHRSEGNAERSRCR